MFPRNRASVERRRTRSQAILLLGLILARFAAAVNPPAPPKWSTFSVDVLLRSRSVNNTIVIMVGTGGFLDLIQNMVCRFSEMQIENYVVNALDRTVWEFCLERNIPALRVTQLGSTKVYPSIGLHHSTEFKSIVREKQVSIQRALSLELNVLMTDVDMFWVKNPLEKVASLTDYDFVIQSGALLKEPRFKWINAGFLYTRPTPAAKSALEEVMNITSGAEIREGIAMNRVLCGDGRFGSDDGTTCTNPEHASRVYILDQTHFQTTDIFLYDANRVVLMFSDIYILHFKNAFNFEYEQKRKFMAETGMWLVDASLNCVGTFNASSIHAVMYNAVKRARGLFIKRCYDVMPGGGVLRNMRDNDVLLVVPSEILFWAKVILLLSCLVCCYRWRRSWGFWRKHGNKGELLGAFCPYKVPRMKPA